MLEHIGIVYTIIACVVVLGVAYFVLHQRARKEHRGRKNILFPSAVEVKAHVASASEVTLQEPMFDADVRVVEGPLSSSRVSKSALPPSLIVVSVMAPAGILFSSYELLQAITNAGFHFGDRHIFHYYADQQHRRNALFSLASAVKPGTFDLDTMGAFSTPGLTLFMDAAMHEYPLAIFQEFIETAQQLAEELEGVLYETPKTLWTQGSYQRAEQCIKQVMQVKNAHKLSIPLHSIQHS